MKVIEVRIRRVRLDRQGYDSRGKYWGVGQALYEVDYATPHGYGFTHFRAHSRNDAIDKFNDYLKNKYGIVRKRKSPRKRNPLEPLRG